MYMSLFIDVCTNLSDMSVAKAASLALMLQERADPSRLFLSARLAIILQMLRTYGSRKKVPTRSEKLEGVPGNLAFSAIECPCI